MVSPELGIRALRQLGPSPQASQARPLEKGVFTPAHCYNRRTHLETRVLQEGAVLLLLGRVWRAGGYASTRTACAKAPPCESLAWPGQVPEPQDVCR